LAIVAISYSWIIHFPKVKHKLSYAEQNPAVQIYNELISQVKPEDRFLAISSLPYFGHGYTARRTFKRPLEKLTDELIKEVVKNPEGFWVILYPPEWVKLPDELKEKFVFIEISHWRIVRAENLGEAGSPQLEANLQLISQIK
jgi:hypothetical protein